MPHRYNFDPTQPPIVQRPCPKCGLPMFLSRIEPTDKIDHAQRTFECSTCAYEETVKVEFAGQLRP